MARGQRGTDGNAAKLSTARIRSIRATSARTSLGSASLHTVKCGLVTSIQGGPPCPGTGGIGARHATRARIARHQDFGTNGATLARLVAAAAARGSDRANRRDAVCARRVRRFLAHVHS
jgi:hypothetical protein